MKLIEALNILNWTGVSIDSRKLNPGELFIAIIGERFDGHDFVKQAFDNGACAAVVSHQPDSCQDNQPLIYVEDTQKALYDLALYYRETLTLPVAALTGSCGKTTTKQMTASILGERYRVYSTPGNLNNHLGAPLSVLNCKQNNEAAVFELGANHPGEIRSNVKLVQPKTALITNVAPAHIGVFGSLEAIFLAKSEIFEGLPNDGWAIYNRDDNFADLWKANLSRCQALTFGLGPEADVSAETIKFDHQMQASFSLKTPQGSVSVQLPFAGRHNVMNALAAAAIGLTFNLSLDEIASGLRKATGISGRMTFKTGIAGSRIIDDTYNANLSSVDAAIEVLSKFSGKRFLVLGDLAELGDWTEAHHRLIGKNAGLSGLDGLFTCGSASRYASESFGDKGFSRHFEDHFSLLEALKDRLASDVTVLVKGSRSSHMENVVDAITLFSDIK